MTNVSPDRPIVTIQQHIIEGQQRYPGATGEFSWLLSGITLATKIIQDRVRQAGLLDVLGATDADNVQGEMVQKLDVIANETLMRCLGYRGNVGMMISEEDAKPRIVQEVGEEGRYVVLFDPLDGSSNIDVNVPIGTIFSILRRKSDIDRNDAMPHILQPGIQQVAAGYVLYGSSTVMVYTAGDGVHIFTLDPSIGAYVLTQENVQMPENGKTYSVNEAYSLTFPRGVRKYLEWAKSAEAKDYSLRTCFKKQGMIPRCCGFVNPQRATSQGRGWVSQPIGLGNQAPTIDLTRFAEYGDNTPLNSGRPSGLRKKPSFEEKTRFHGK